MKNFICANKHCKTVPEANRNHQDFCVFFNRNPKFIKKFSKQE